ncbi:MAG: response regulator, partial [Rhodobacterales bacterium]
MRILSVDDDPIILELLAAVLVSMGHTDVTTAGSATEALEIVKDDPEPFDCFLLDIQMPGIDGIQLCK